MLLLPRYAISFIVIFHFVELPGAIRAISKIVRYAVKEECEPMTFIGNPLRDSGILQRNIHGGSSLFIQLMFGNRDELQLNESTGDLFTKDRLDRENICVLKSRKQQLSRRPLTSHKQGRNLAELMATRLVQYANVTPRTVLNDCQIELSIVVRDAGLSEDWINVQIIIKDVDDNQPYFEVDHINLTISELTLVGAHFQLPEASDLDAPEHAVKKYALIDLNSTSPQETPTFGIICHNGSATAAGECDLRLIILRSLDFETVANYELLLVAEGNQYSPGLTVEIAVKNENEHKPTFIFPIFDTHGEHKVFLSQTAPIGSLVVSLQAVDADKGEAGLIAYFIDTECKPEVVSNMARYFQVNKTQGDIIIRHELNDLSVNHFHLTVCATDHGNPKRSGQGVLDIVVSDESKDLPIIYLKPLGGETMSGEQVSVFIPSIADRDTLVALVWVAGGDRVQENRTFCSLRYAKHGNFSLWLDLIEGGLILDRRTYALKITRAYNFSKIYTIMRDEVSRLKASIFCTTLVSNGTQTPFAVETNLALKLSLPEEQKFRFTASEICLSVEESSRSITNFYSLTTLNEVGWVEFGRRPEITALANSGFDDCQNMVVHPRTGQLSLPFGVDREITPMLSCTFVAVDHGSKSIQGNSNVKATVKVSVTVTDVNDNAPTLSQAILDYGINISEFDGRGSLQWTSLDWVHLLSIKAFDLDAGPNGSVLFELRNVRLMGLITQKSLQRLPRFKLSSYSGELLIRATDYPLLDREVVEGFVVTIKLSDLGSPFRLTGVYDIRVYLMDVNDNGPLFIDPRTEMEAPVSVNGVFILDNMPWYSSKETTLGFWTQLRVFDPDAGENRTVQFRVKTNATVAVHTGINILKSHQVALFGDGRVWIDAKHLGTVTKHVVYIRVSDNGRHRQLFADAELRINLASVQKQRPMSSVTEHPRDFSRRHAGLTRQVYSSLSLGASKTSQIGTISAHTLLLFAGAALMFAIFVSILIAYCTLRKKPVIIGV